MKKNIHLWVVTDDKIGNLNPARGLAESIKTRLSHDYYVNIVYKTLFLKKIFRFLYRGALLHLPCSPSFLLKHVFKGDCLTRNPPDIIIGNGRASVEATVLIKRAAAAENKPCSAIQLQSPRISSRHYDCVIPPKHDLLEGENVFPIIGSPAHITLETLQSLLLPEHQFLESLPSPRFAVMIGGKSKNYEMTDHILQKLADDLTKLSTDYGASLMITTSRRTAPRHKQQLKERLSALPQCYVWDEEIPNPYSAFLKLADAFVITGDSANMISEAAHLRKPIFMYPLQGEAGKFMLFYQSLYARQLMRPFSLPLSLWTPPLFNETSRAAEHITNRIMDFLSEQDASAS